MICPYCNQEMKKGRIENRKETLSWSPKGESKGIFPWSVSKNGILLSKMITSDWDPGVDAFYCDQCKKIIIDVSKNK